jgi:hypothetical protein
MGMIGSVYFAAWLLIYPHINDDVGRKIPRPNTEWEVFDLDFILLENMLGNLNNATSAVPVGDGVNKQIRRTELFHFRCGKYCSYESQENTWVGTYQKTTSSFIFCHSPNF